MNMVKIRRDERHPICEDISHHHGTCDLCNKRIMEVKSGCDANDDGIPPNNKLLGILPNEL